MIVVRVTVALLVVLGLMWTIARVARRPMARRGGGALTVLARQRLGRSASVTVLRIGDQALVLGVTDQQVSLLGEADPAAFGDAAPSGPARRSAVRLAGSATPGVGIPGGEAAGGQRSNRDGGTGSGGRLAGSALSPRTWSQALDVLRERTVRKS